MRIKSNIAISDSGFIFNPSTGDSYSINQIGQDIIKMLQKNKTKEDIKKYILDNYLTDESTFEKDFYDFSNMLRTNKLIEDGQA